MKKENFESFHEKRGQGYGVLHFHVEEACGFFELMSEKFGFHRQSSEELVRLGAVYVNGARVLSNDQLRLKALDYLRVHTNPRRYDLQVFDIKKNLLFENEDFVVVNKPAGLPVHSLVDNSVENLLSVLETQTGQRFFITSRLDVATGGLIVYAKNEIFQKRFNGQIQKGRVEKVYSAAVERRDPHGALLSGRLKHYMEVTSQAPKNVSHTRHQGWQLCELEIMSAKKIPQGPFLQYQIQLLTGRTHQIRAQLSVEGQPILGDHLYGSLFRSPSHEKIALFCQRLSFLESYRFEANSDFELDFDTWLQSLQKADLA